MTHTDELKNSGLKATLPRIKILDVFQRSPQRHMTAEDVYKALLHDGSGETSWVVEGRPRNGLSLRPVIPALPAILVRNAAMLAATRPGPYCPTVRYTVPVLALPALLITSSSEPSPS